jgi:hypothetical protein
VEVALETTSAVHPPIRTVVSCKPIHVPFTLAGGSQKRHTRPLKKLQSLGLELTPLSSHVIGEKNAAKMVGPYTVSNVSPNAKNGQETHFLNKVNIVPIKVKATNQATTTSINNIVNKINHKKNVESATTLQISPVLERVADAGRSLQDMTVSSRYDVRMNTSLYLSHELLNLIKLFPF